MLPKEKEEVEEHMKNAELLFKRMLVMLLLLILSLGNFPTISTAIVEEKLESSKYLIVEEKKYIARIIPETRNRRIQK